MSSFKYPLIQLYELASDQKGSISGGPFGSDLVTSDYVPVGVPVVRGQNLPLENNFSHDNLVYVTESKADKLHYNCAKPGDIVFTQRGTLGQVGIIPKGFYQRYLISQSQMKFTPNHYKCNVNYVYYYFKQKSIVEYIKNIALQSGVPHINLGILKKIPISLPPLPIQRKIAAILSAYDELIENNNRRIAILEKMAEEIYREWFVRLRFPGYEKVKVVKGVPEGWEVKRLSDILELNYGKALKEENRTGDGFPVFGSSGIVGYHKNALVKGPGIIVGRKGNVGSVHWVESDFFPIDTAYYVKTNISLFFVFYLLQTMNFINNDSAVPGLNRSQAYSNLVYFPTDELIKNFTSLISHLFMQINHLKSSNTNLKSTRDLLLPRLISGKLDVEHLDIAFPPGMEEEAAND